MPPTYLSKAYNVTHCIFYNATFSSLDACCEKPQVRQKRVFTRWNGSMEPSATRCCRCTLCKYFKRQTLKCTFLPRLLTFTYAKLQFSSFTELLNCTIVLTYRFVFRTIKILTIIKTMIKSMPDNCHMPAIATVV